MLYTYKNYQIQHQQLLARFLLTIWLPIICSPEAIYAASPSESTMVSAASTSTDTPAMSPPTALILTAQGGHQVTFQQNNGTWEAEVHEKLPTGSSNQRQLPVSITEGLPWQELTSFSEATQRQRVVVDSTLESSCVHIDSRGLWRNTQPLYKVIKQGAGALVPEILERQNVDINAVDDQGWSALHWAVNKGYIETAALLIRHGANVALKDHQGKTPLAYADEADVEYFSAIAELLPLYSPLDNLIANGVRKNQVEIQQQLHEMQDHINYLDREPKEQYDYFKFKFHELQFSYLEALGEKSKAAAHEELVEKYQKSDLSLLSLDAFLQETMAAASSTSQEASQFLNDQKDDKSLYKESGDNMWRQFLEYWYAQQDQLGLLTRLGNNNWDYLSPEQKESLQDVIAAHRFYGSSCHAAAQDQDLRSQVHLSAIMALRLSIIGCFLEANMYALSICSRIINSPSSEITVKDLRKAQALLARLQAAQSACDDRPTTASSPINTLNTLRNVNRSSKWRCATATVQDGYSHTEKLHIKYAIAQDLQAIARELLPSSSRTLASPPVCDGRPTTSSSPINTLDTLREVNFLNLDTKEIKIKCAIAQDLQELARDLFPSNICNLARPQIPEEVILAVAQRAKRYQQARVGTGVVGCGLLLWAFVGLGGYALVKFVLTGKKSLLPIWLSWRSLFAAASGIFGFLALKYGRSLWNKGASMMQESATRRGLNAIIEQALTHYDQGEMQKFFDTLANTYAKHKSLFLPKKVEGQLPGKRIKEILTTHGFRLDDVAYLLHRMGEALSSSQVNVAGWSSDILVDIACDSFPWVLTRRFTQPAPAQGLDTSAEIGQVSAGNAIKKYFQSLQDFLLLRDEASFLASTPHEKTTEMLVAKILEAVRHLARMNLITATLNFPTIYISQRKCLRQKNRLAESLVQEARRAIEYYLQYYDMPPLRLAAFKDYVGVISEHIVAITTPEVDHHSHA